MFITHPFLHGQQCGADGHHHIGGDKDDEHQFVIGKCAHGTHQDKAEQGYADYPRRCLPFGYGLVVIFAKGLLPLVFDGNVERVNFKEIECDHAHPHELIDNGIIFKKLLLEQ